VLADGDEDPADTRLVLANGDEDPADTRLVRLAGLKTRPTSVGRLS
jgi:hypothetical protein